MKMLVVRLQKAIGFSSNARFLVMLILLLSFGTGHAGMNSDNGQTGKKISKTQQNSGEFARSMDNSTMRHDHSMEQETSDSDSRSVENESAMNHETTDPIMMDHEHMTHEHTTGKKMKDEKRASTKHEGMDHVAMDHGEMDHGSMGN